MASPHPKNGHIDVAHELADQFESYGFTTREWKLIWVIWRQTWGWLSNPKDKNSPKLKMMSMTLAMFSKRTGIKRQGCHSILKNLIKKNIIKKEKCKKTGKIEYGFQSNYDLWDKQVVTPDDYTCHPQRLQDTPINNKQVVTPDDYTCHPQRLQVVTPRGYKLSPPEVTSNIYKDNIKDTNKDTLLKIPSTPKKRVDVTHKKPNNHELIVYEKNKTTQNKEITDFVLNFIEYTIKTFGNLAPKQTKTLFDKSYDAIDKLIRLDKLSFQYVYDVLLWSCRDEFWKDKVKSLAGLRKKKDDLTKFQKIATAYEQAQSTGSKRRLMNSIQKLNNAGLNNTGF